MRLNQLPGQDDASTVCSPRVPAGRTASTTARPAASGRPAIAETDFGRLAPAMLALARSHARRFEDELWLTFGDEWTAVRKQLVRCGLVRYPRYDAGDPALTDQGRVLADRLAAIAGN